MRLVVDPIVTVAIACVAWIAVACGAPIRSPRPRRVRQRVEPPRACIAARRLWFEDFEVADYRRWTGNTYGGDWGDSCQANGFSDERHVSGSRSHRSEITCAYAAAHRGYGGVQFDGDAPLPAFTNRGEGIVAEHGVINTFWTFLEAGYDFGDGRWLSLFTVNGSCDWSERVITLGFENPSWRLTPAHIVNTGGTVTFAEDAPSFPRGRWVRITILINYPRGELHVWQDGASLLHGTFARPSRDICHFHWGAYASGDNDDIVLFEDDNAVWRLDAPWTDLTREPWLVDPACPRVSPDAVARDSHDR